MTDEAPKKRFNLKNKISAEALRGKLSAGLRNRVREIIKKSEDFNEYTDGKYASLVQAFTQHVPLSWQNRYVRIVSGRASPRTLIKAKCMCCADFDRQLVRSCKQTQCALHPHRPYRLETEEVRVSLTIAGRETNTPAVLKLFQQSVTKPKKAIAAYCYTCMGGSGKNDKRREIIAQVNGCSSPTCVFHAKRPWRKSAQLVAFIARRFKKATP